MNLLAFVADSGGFRMFLKAVVSASVYPALLFQFLFALLRSGSVSVDNHLGSKKRKHTHFCGCNI